MRATIRQFILDNYMYGMEHSDLTDQTSFLESGILDSTGVMELITFLESEFSIKIDDTEILPENLDSVDSILRFLAAKGQNERPASSAGA